MVAPSHTSGPPRSAGAARPAEPLAVAALHADRAERAADLADRFVRWGVGLMLGAVLVLAFAVLRGDAELGAEIADLRAAVDEVLDRLDAAAEPQPPPSETGAPRGQ